MAGRRDDDQSAFRITLEVDNDSALPKLLEGRVSKTLVLNPHIPSHIISFGIFHNRLLQY